MPTKRRANNEGTLYYNLKKDLWQAMLTTPAGNRLTKAGKDKTAVQDWLNEQRLLVGRGKHIEPHSVTLGEWIGEWLETYARIKVRPRTYDRYVSLLKHLSPLYGVRLLDLTTSDIQKIYNKKTETLSAQTVRYIAVCLSICLKQAVTNKILPDNPASRTIKPKPHKKEMEIFTPGEKAAILEAAERHRNALAVHLALETGLRISEIFGLFCEDIQEGRLTVARSLHVSSQGKKYEDTKTTASYRTIVITPELAKKISGHKIKHGIRTGPLFLNKNGEAETPPNYAKRTFAKIQKETGLKKGLHSFRHTHASELLAAGISIHDLSRRLGHAKISTTLDIYVHFLPSSDEKMLAALSSLQTNRRPKTK